MIRQEECCIYVVSNTGMVCHAVTLKRITRAANYARKGPEAMGLRPTMCDTNGEVLLAAYGSCRLGATYDASMTASKERRPRN